MKSPFLDAMRRATDSTRGGDLAEATRAIQDALSGTASRDTFTDDFDGVTIDGTTGGPVDTGSDAASASEILPMLSQTYRCAAGARDYRLFLPPQAPDGLRGLVLMLHGCTQNPDDFAMGTGMNAIAAREGLAVAYPAQTATHNANNCWNWFEPTHQRRDTGEPAILAGLVTEVARTHDVPVDRTFAAGLSAGGAMAAILGSIYPEVFSAIGVHSGLPAGSAKDVGSAFAAMKGGGSASALTPDSTARSIIVHGARDKTVVPANGVRLFEAMTIAFPEAALRREPPTEKGLTRLRLVMPDGRTVAEHWEVAGLGHAWSGGDRAGTFTAPRKPNASEAFVRFFLDQKG